MSTYSINRSQTTVLGNAYAGLALLMLPTAVGSYLTASVFSAQIAQHPLAFLITEVVAIFGLMFAIFANRDNAAGFGLSLIFAFFMGSLMGPGIDHVIHAHSNGSTLVALAAIGTAGLFVGLSAFVHITGKDFQGLGAVLYASLWGLIIAGIANMFLHSTLIGALCSGIGVAVFSGYILYDTSNALKGREANWIIVCLNLYLDVVNLFMDLLNLLSIFGGGSDD